MIMIEGIIYMFTNKINKKKYVGQTIHEKARYANHLSNKRNKSLVDKAIEKYGIDNFEYDVLHRCNGIRENVIQELNYYETLYISRYGTIVPNGYNLQTGGNMNYDISDETRKKLSEASKRQWTEEKKQQYSESLKGHQGWLKYHTDSAKKKISERSKERWANPEYRERVITSIKKTYEKNEKKPRKGHPISEETKRKIGMKNKGRIISEESRKKMSESAKRRVISEETKKKLSESIKKWWSDRKAIF